MQTIDKKKYDNNWREYFSMEEIENAINNLKLSLESIDNEKNDELMLDSDNIGMNPDKECTSKYLLEEYQNPNFDTNHHISTEVRKQILTVGNFRRLMKNKEESQLHAGKAEFKNLKLIVKGKNYYTKRYPIQNQRKLNLTAHNQFTSQDNISNKDLIIMQKNTALRHKINHRNHLLNTNFKSDYAKHTDYQDAHYNT